MSNGVKILDTVTKKCFVKQEGKNRFRIILTQGLNRQIRRMCAALGYEVDTLRRTRIMHITLNNLPTGKWRYFTPDEIKLMEISLAQSIKTADSSLSNETNWNE
jgi:23S rRNA pseudouridine2604 synthase